PKRSSEPLGRLTSSPSATASDTSPNDRTTAHNVSLELMDALFSTSPAILEGARAARIAKEFQRLRSATSDPPARSAGPPAPRAGSRRSRAPGTLDSPPPTRPARLRAAGPPPAAPALRSNRSRPRAARTRRFESPDAAEARALRRRPLGAGE